jgi:hypothetical protein
LPGADNSSRRLTRCNTRDGECALTKSTVLTLEHYYRFDNGPLALMGSEVPVNAPTRRADAIPYLVEIAHVMESSVLHVVITRHHPRKRGSEAGQAY